MSDAFPITTRPQSGRTGTCWTFPHLLLKELQGSRGLFIAGFWTFFLMPFLLEVAYLIVIREGLTSRFPFVYFTTMGLGWLYAVIAGAQVVCRDWGQSEEHFMRAQPVSSSSIVLSKWIAGLIVLAVLNGICLAWAALAVSQGGEYSKSVSQLFSPTLIVLLIMLMGYSIAFAVAFVTRQMLSAVLIASLALASWWVAPYLSHRLNFLHPFGWLEQGDPWFVFLVILAGGICLVAPLIASNRETALRLSGKGIAWMLASFVLVLGGLAYQEVGSSLPVRDSRAVTVKPDSRELSGLYPLGVASHGNTAFMFAVGENRIIGVTRVELSEDGRIQEVGLTDVQQLVRKSGVNLGGMPEITAQSSHKSTLTSLSHFRKELKLSRVSLSWEAGKQAAVDKIDMRSFPVKEGWASTEPVSSDRYSYLLVRSDQIPPQSPSTSYQDEPSPGFSRPPSMRLHFLYLYDWTSPPGTPPEMIATLQGEFLSLQRVGQRIAVYERSGQRFVVEAGFDMDDPATLVKQTAKPHFEPVPLLFDHVTTAAIFNSVWLHRADISATAMAYDIDMRFAYFSNREGVGVCDENEHLIGMYSMNPLAAMLRGSTVTRLIPMSGHRLIEVDDKLLSAYDFSDPRSPRRIGFFNIAHIDGTLACAVGEYIVLFEGARVTVLAPPR